jgi:O-antigen/teichoic acid export membrane protein
MAVNLGGVVGINALGVVTGSILAHALGPSARGVLGAAVLWPQIVWALLLLGVNDAITYFTSRAQVSVRAVWDAGRRIAALQSLAIVVVGIPVVYLAMRHFGNSALVSALVYLAAMPAALCVIHLIYFINGLHRYGWFTALQLQIYVLNTVGVAVLWAVGELTVRSAVLVYVGSFLAALATATVVARTSIRGAPTRRDPGLVRALLDYGLRSQLTNFPHILNDRVDQLVISVVLPARSLGLYVVAASIATAPAFVGAAVSNSVMPTVASLEAAADRVRAARRAVVLTTLVTLAASFVLALAMRPLISIVFGRAFLGAVGPARVLAFAAVMISLARVFHGVLKGIGRPLDAATSEGGALLVTAIGLGALLYPLGIMGAAWTSLAAYSTSVLIGARLAGSALGAHPIEFLLGRL